MRLTHLVLGIATIAAASGLASLPAGGDAPWILRTVTLNALRGPAFYSAPDRRFVFVASPIATVDLIAGASDDSVGNEEEIASLAVPSDLPAH
ncbi:hypothetical protein [Consotaella aegiceratis]|uniref:hypothetical protein n=1 Tax=Consotaella aegiceratis TaxID=3097961 RepID=UPI002F40FEAB